MRVLVTRPASQAAQWVAHLREAGIDAVALPLIHIGDPPDPAPVRAAWANLSRLKLVVFVSPNAAERFMAAGPADVSWPAGVDAAAVGPGTARVLQATGVPAAQIVEPSGDAPQFDSEALWEQLRARDWRGAAVLIVRGDGGREWLADQMRAHGAAVALVCAYRRSAPVLDSPGQTLLREALAAPRSHLWFFSSSEAIANLAELAGSGVDWSLARALATHPRIAVRAQQLGIRDVSETRPSLESVRACIQSMPP